MPELPPTAGMPLRMRDLVGAHGASLVHALEPVLGPLNMQTTCSGTAALVIALTTLAADSNRQEVIVPAYTCPLVAMAIAHCGLRVQVCDLAAGGIEMDMARLEALCGSNTLAIVPTHLAGRVTDIVPVMHCAARSGAHVIEDAAQAMGARYADGTPVGMAGDAGFFSLAAGKGLTTYEGGLLVSRHLALHVGMRRAARALLPRRYVWELRRSIELLGYAAFYRPCGLGLVHGRSVRRSLARGDREAAAGDVFPRGIPLHRLGGWRESVAARAGARYPDFLRVIGEQAKPRIERLSKIDGVTTIRDTAGAQGTWPVLMLLLPRASVRDALLSRYWGAGIGVALPFVRALPDYRWLQDIIPASDVPQARDFASRVMTVTNSPWLDEAAFARLADGIERACNDVDSGSLIA